MQVQQSHNQSSPTQNPSSNRVNLNIPTRDQFQSVAHHTSPPSNVTYRQLAQQAKLRDRITPIDQVDVGQPSTSPSNLTSQESSTSTGKSNVPSDLNTPKVDIHPESTPQATLEKAQEIKQQILHNQDPSLHNPQLLMKAQLLERKAKAQLHKDHMTQRFVKAPRLL